jgi:hypothetical protein
VQDRTAPGSLIPTGNHRPNHPANLIRIAVVIPIAIHRQTDTPPQKGPASRQAETRIKIAAEASPPGTADQEVEQNHGNANRITTTKGNPANHFPATGPVPPKDFQNPIAAGQTDPVTAIPANHAAVTTLQKVDLPVNPITKVKSKENFPVAVPMNQNGFQNLLAGGRISFAEATAANHPATGIVVLRGRNPRGKDRTEVIVMKIDPASGLKEVSVLKTFGEEMMKSRSSKGSTVGTNAALSKKTKPLQVTTNKLLKRQRRLRLKRCV